MKHLFIFFLGLILINGCAVSKQLQISDGSKADGTLTMMYEYGDMEKPVVQWEGAKSAAKAKCKLWGYRGADFFDVGKTECINQTQYGCAWYRVTYKCQCTN